MADNHGFAKLVPGFEFLQSLAKNAGSTLPSIGHWVAPTLNPEEIEKRIEELRTVKFWLEQNGRMLDATIQALEVQRMTLTTLKTMNVQMGDLREAMMIRKPAAPTAPTSTGTPSATDVATSAMAAATSAATAFANAFQFPKATPASPSQATASTPTATAVPAATPAPTPVSTPASTHLSMTGDSDAASQASESPRASTSMADAPGKAVTGAVDPMQWWGALTKQFTALATAALQEGVAVRPAIPEAEPPLSTKTSVAPTAAKTQTPRAPARRAAPSASSSSSIGSAPKSQPAPRKKAVRKSPGR